MDPLERGYRILAFILIICKKHQTMTLLLRLHGQLSSVLQKA